MSTSHIHLTARSFATFIRQDDGLRMLVLQTGSSETFCLFFPRDVEDMQIAQLSHIINDILEVRMAANDH